MGRKKDATKARSLGTLYGFMNIRELYYRFSDGKTLKNLQKIAIFIRLITEFLLKSLKKRTPISTKTIYL
jgi:hypothetical protein